MIFVMLFMTLLPATLVTYTIGLIFIRKLKITKAALLGGFISTWIFTSIIALILAQTPNVNSASEKAMPAATIASIIGIGGIAVIGRRRSPLSRQKVGNRD